ncbi:uncharacterized protein KY384_006323 [Bacidia gigantensis]|uniref:uncharacterized protein n=1 Tax=Bacidia gigantensis TaxID=2732470 RepID=UPI001D03DE5C|nr:uncharacterized protein KY384_006323 [Bacidia gigantensis]KAG8528636.1 hypothetical protein KY384_006323 [Bacidia gigantensis]
MPPIKMLKELKSRLSLFRSRKTSPSQEPAAQTASPFFRLPCEIRLQIYRLLLVIDPFRCQFGDWDIHLDGHLFLTVAILRVCKRVYNEACPILYQDNLLVSVLCKGPMELPTMARLCIKPPGEIQAEFAPPLTMHVTKRAMSPKMLAKAQHFLLDIYRFRVLCMYGYEGVLWEGTKMYLEFTSAFTQATTHLDTIRRTLLVCRGASECFFLSASPQMDTLAISHIKANMNDPMDSILKINEMADRIEQQGRDQLKAEHRYRELAYRYVDLYDLMGCKLYDFVVCFAPRTPRTPEYLATVARMFQYLSRGAQWFLRVGDADSVLAAIRKLQGAPRHILIKQDTTNEIHAALGSLPSLTPFPNRLAATICYSFGEALILKGDDTTATYFFLEALRRCPRHSKANKAVERQEARVRNDSHPIALRAVKNIQLIAPLRHKQVTLNPRDAADNHLLLRNQFEMAPGDAKYKNFFQGSILESRPLADTD